MSAEPASKKARTQSLPSYELLYHPTIPGRGEFVRLVFAAAGVPYIDVAKDQPDAFKTVVQPICMDASREESADGQPPLFAPPALRVRGDDVLIINQTPNILAYLGEQTGLDGGAARKWHVAQVALTALDLNNEVHDTHHPISGMKYYEDQKVEALAKATDVRESRVPKYLSYFTRVLRHNRKANGGEGKYLVGDALTYADTTVWQVLDGLMFAFPKEMAARKSEFEEILGNYYEGIKGERGIEEYLASDRRLPYSMGVFRHYPELDRQ